jgi:CO/xanthine dehydrogenase FAD-binding subunit
MTKVARYAKPSTREEALAARRAESSAQWLAGGTVLLAGEARDKPESVIDLAAFLPRDILRDKAELAIGAGATFQEIAGSKAVPPCLAEAALTMVNRNTRNRATLGGNLGADKSCSSLIPILIALEAEVEVASPASGAIERLALEAWLALRAEGRSSVARAADLALRVLVPIRGGTRAAYRRWNRASCDLSVLGAAAAFRVEGGATTGLRIALGGLGPKARRFPALEALFEGAPPPGRDEIEEAVAPLLRPIGDLRASASFKRLRGAQLAAEAFLAALELGDIWEAQA